MSKNKTTRRSGHSQPSPKIISTDPVRLDNSDGRDELRSDPNNMNDHPIRKDLLTDTKGLEDDQHLLESDELIPDEEMTLQQSLSTEDEEDDIRPVDGLRRKDELDIPGSELDDDVEEIGSEDEENNYYSLGSDRHEDLEEDDQ